MAPLRRWLLACCMWGSPVVALVASSWACFAASLFVRDGEALLADTELVQACDGHGCGLRGVVRHEAKTSREASLAVHHDACRHNASEGGEEVKEVLVRHVVGDVEDEQVGAAGALRHRRYLEGGSWVDGRRVGCS